MQIGYLNTLFLLSTGTVINSLESALFEGSSKPKIRFTDIQAPWKGLVIITKRNARGIMVIRDCIVYLSWFRFSITAVKLKYKNINIEESSYLVFLRLQTHLNSVNLSGLNWLFFRIWHRERAWIDCFWWNFGQKGYVNHQSLFQVLFSGIWTSLVQQFKLFLNKRSQRLVSSCTVNAHRFLNNIVLLTEQICSLTKVAVN